MGLIIFPWLGESRLLHRFFFEAPEDSAACRGEPATEKAAHIANLGPGKVDGAGLGVAVALFLQPSLLGACEGVVAGPFAELHQDNKHQA